MLKLQGAGSNVEADAFRCLLDRLLVLPQEFCLVLRPLAFAIPRTEPHPRSDTPRAIRPKLAVGQSQMDRPLRGLASIGLTTKPAPTAKLLIYGWITQLFPCPCDP